jgi:hypothetical protein
MLAYLIRLNVPKRSKKKLGLKSQMIFGSFESQPMYAKHIYDQHNAFPKGRWSCIIAVLLLSLYTAPASLSSAQANKIVDAIYVVEGGAATLHPYGIKSIQTSTPRKVCLNTIVNNYYRWDGRGDFLDYLGDRYCPPSCDAAGNRNWKRNMHSLITKSIYNNH